MRRVKFVMRLHPPFDETRFGRGISPMSPTSNNSSRAVSAAAFALAICLSDAGASFAWSQTAESSNAAASIPALPTTDAAGPHALSPRQLAAWIDQELYGASPPPLIDDATYLRRVSLDLLGCIPGVSTVRDFLGDASPYKRSVVVEQILTDRSRTSRLANRGSEHLARVWRRVLVPGNGPGAAMAASMDPWLKANFAETNGYDDFARRLIVQGLAAPVQPTGDSLARGQGVDGPQIFRMAVGGTPESMATSVTRVFLGVRIGCAQCHNHPFASWKQEDFWGMAAYFAPPPAPVENQPFKLVIRPSTMGDREYDARVLWTEQPQVSYDRPPIESFADWLVSPKNPNFAATAVNRVWQFLCGRGVTDSVDDLDGASPEERLMLDGLAARFTQAKFDTRWLMTGICLSKTYQRECGRHAADSAAVGERPLKTLLPEQVFDSLEQALALPVSKVDDAPRHNGMKSEMVRRWNEAVGANPEDFRGGIPQTLLMMNGKLTSAATDLKTSRTLRAVVEAPFLQNDEKLNSLYLATLTRLPSEAEREHLTALIEEQTDVELQKQTFSEIFWALINSPEFVLSR